MIKKCVTLFQDFQSLLTWVTHNNKRTTAAGKLPTVSGKLVLVDLD